LAFNTTVDAESLSLTNTGGVFDGIDLTFTGASAFQFAPAQGRGPATLTLATNIPTTVINDQTVNLQYSSAATLTINGGNVVVNTVTSDDDITINGGIVTLNLGVLPASGSTQSGPTISTAPPVRSQHRPASRPQPRKKH